jgi:putative transposase
VTGTPVARSYRLPSSANASKLAAVAGLLPLWRAGLGRSQSVIRRHLLTTGELPRWVDAKGWDGGLSQRQWDSVSAQALGAHRSWLGNCERVFRDLVLGSGLDADTVRDLLYVNKARAWYRPADGGGPVRLSAAKTVPAPVLRLARVIMRQARKRVGAPDLRRVSTMMMDGKVARVAPAEEAGHADYWVRVSTGVRGRPVLIPLHAHRALTERLTRPGAVLASHCQVVIRPGGGVEFRLVVKTPQAAPGPERTRDVALGWGLATLFAASDGTLHGHGFLERLRDYDERLQPLVAALNRQHVPLRKSARYRALAQDIRGFVTNEVNRCLNRLLDPGKGGDPAIARVITEKLDFRGLARAGKLSRALRRILGSAGRAAVTRKLESLREDHGIEPVQENAAYTSQECDGCGYVATSNRQSRSLFRCRFCGKTVHADIGGARTLLRRSQAGGLPPCRNRGQLLDCLDERFRARWGLTFADVAQRQHQHDRAPRVAPRADPQAAPTAQGRRKGNRLPSVA